MKKQMLLMGLSLLLAGVLAGNVALAAPQSSEAVSPDGVVNEVKPGPRATPETVPKVDPDLDLSTDDYVGIIVHLEDQPRHEINLEVRQRYEEELDQLTSEIREINSKYAIKEPSPVDPAPVPLTPADKSSIDNLNRQLKDLTIQMRREVTEEVRRRTEYQQEGLSRYVESIGGRVTYGYTLFNGVAAFVPGTRIQELSHHPSVRYVVKDRSFETHLVHSTPSIGAGTWWGNGYTGGVWWGAVLDTGTDTGHPSLDWHDFHSEVFHDAAKTRSNYDDDPSSTDDLQGHGTHVGGIVWSRGQLLWDQHKGVAYGADYCINAKVGYRTTGGGGGLVDSDIRKGADWAITDEYADAVNCSFGHGLSSDDDDAARFWDGVVDDEDVPVAVSAGNSGPNDKTLGSPSIAYNVLCVGAMDDKTTSWRSDDGIWSGSSRGPTYGGRKKPDLVAPGEGTLLGLDWGIWSCENDYEYFPWVPFIGMRGTSMAAPHVMGAILLYKNWGGFKNAKIIKAVFINTCDDWGAAGWDNAYGWGYLNLSEAWTHRSDYFTGSVTESGTTGDHRFYKGTMYNGDKATLVWHRHVAYNGTQDPSTYYDLNDLDLKLYKQSDGSLLDLSWSVEDNVEQVTTTATYDVVVKVEAYSSPFSHGTTESFALATEEAFSAAARPTLAVTVNNPANVPTSDEFTVTVPVKNNGGVTVFNTSVILTLPPDFSIVSGANPQSVGDLGPGATGTATWTVESPSYQTSGVISATASSYSYGETYTGSDTSPINVLSPVDILEDLLEATYTPPNPWTQEGLIELTFHVQARLMDLTHITFSSDDLIHETLEKRIDGHTINFSPQEIGFLPEDEVDEVTVHVEIPIGQHEGLYTGYFNAVASNGASDNVFVEITVNQLADLDMDREVVLLEAFGGQADSDLFVVVNPNSWDNNPDPTDGPGNVDIASVGYSFTGLVGAGGTVPATALSVSDNSTAIGSGAADEVTLGVDVLYGTPAGKYKGKAYVSGTPAMAKDGMARPKIGLVIPQPVTDSLTVELTVLPEGMLDIVEDLAGCTVTPPDPWTDPLSGQLTFRIANNGTDTLKNIELLAGNLEMMGYDPLQGGSVEFIPPVVGYLAPNDTLAINAFIPVPVGQYAGDYGGAFTALASNGASDFVSVNVEVEALPDLDIDDNEANLAANTMELRGVAGSTVSGTYNLVNPNVWESNCDPFDGPGNTDLSSFTYSWTDLVSYGGNDTIPASNIDPNANGISSLAYGDAAQNMLTVAIPMGAPLFTTYTGTVTVTAQPGDVSDSFTLEVTVVPTSGGVPEIVEGDVLPEVTFTPTNPWVAEGVLELLFSLTSAGDLTHISLTSDDLTHESLDNKIDGSTVSFTPQEIGHIGPHDTVEVKACVEVPIGQHEGLYRGFFRVVACNGESDSVLASVRVNPLADVDIQDYSDNMVANEMNLVGCANSIVVGAFDLLNPNMMDNNVDLFDGPGNVPIEDLAADWGHLWTYGHNHKIHRNNVSLVAPFVDPLLSGFGQQVLVQVDIPKITTPRQKTYSTPFEVTGEGAGVAVSDQFTLKVHVVPKGDGDSHISCFWGTSADGENLLEWTDFGFGEIGFNVYRCDGAMTEFSRLNPVLLTGNSYPDVGVFSGAAYEYKLGLRLAGGGEIMLGPLSLQAGGRTPTSYALLQNQPNPFGSKTELRFLVAAAGNTTLRVYDSAGRLVRTLVNDHREPGYYSVDWDGKDDAGVSVSAGVYVYRLQSGNFNRTRKMIVLR